MLAIDIGNTFTRLVAFAGDQIRARRSIFTRDLDVVDLMAAFAELAPLSDGGGAWVSSVVPKANALVDSAAERSGLSRRFIKPGVDAIIPHSLKTPQTTGTDRLLSSMAAGIRHFPGAGDGRGYVTIQCGSAATVDFVDAAGVFRGGYILPGPSMWLSGLTSAAQLPDLSDEPPDWTAVTVGDNTKDAMLHGRAAALPMAIASAAMMADVRPGGQAAAARTDGPPVVVTGGWGEAVARVFSGKFAYDKDLLLHGIRLFAERNS